MNIVRVAGAALFSLMLLVPPLPGQEKGPSEGKAAVLKLQVTIGEQEGEKKLASLPYNFFLKVGEGAPPSPWTKVRMGSRVPVNVGKDGGIQYIDVGTNIDCRGVMDPDGRFDIYLNLERSWVEGDAVVPADKPAAAAGEAPQFKEPIIRQLKTEVTLIMRDGQTIQSTQATDPLSGRVLTITVTMSVVK
jgi:hypothetical protein